VPSLEKLLATVVCAATIVAVAACDRSGLNFSQESSPKPDTIAEAGAQTNNEEPEIVAYSYSFEPILDKVLVSDGSVLSVLNETEKTVGLQLIPTGYMFFALPEVEPGRTYTWSGRIRAETAGIISVAAWDGEFTRSLLDVGTEWSDFEVVAQPDQPRLRLYIDTRMKGVTIGEVELQLGAVRGK
jgi:hypothetical protein